MVLPEMLADAGPLTCDHSTVNWRPKVGRSSSPMRPNRRRAPDAPVIVLMSLPAEASGGSLAKSALHVTVTEELTEFPPASKAQTVMMFSPASSSTVESVHVV